MTTLNDYFEKIYCINLDKRKDRWKESRQEFKKHDLKVQRFSALSGDDFPEDSVLGKRYRSIGLNAGQVGCTLSHRELIKKIKSKKFKSALILEDDIQFDDNLNEKIPFIMDQLPEDWDIFYFGGNHVGNNPWSNGSLTQVTENIFKVTHCYTTHAYAVKETVYDKIIECFKDSTITHVDECLSRIQSQINCYIVRPHIAWQRPSFSDLRNMFLDMPFLYDDKSLFEGRHFGKESLQRDDVYDKLDDREKIIFDKQKRENNY
jgi:GR25 family glycosyltransferase involved in LPS biosynthesis